MKALALGILLTLSTGVSANAFDLVNIGSQSQPIIIDKDSITAIPGGYKFTLLFQDEGDDINYAQYSIYCRNKTMLNLGGGQVVNNSLVQTYGRDEAVKPILVNTVASVYYNYLCN